ncbi:hypothetical protein [Latilactobacillus sakei]|uniref:Uncharacterized protein n=1 Tax=Latilactobacillus sakei TaxID=1599 RepID=A0AAF0K9J3_LATSK|nr:hypothetical protein [Latilactobacillus sakei]WGI18575.1 hypothetical protein QBD03_07405 [Latilactobacillus sakei]
MSSIVHQIIPWLSTIAAWLIFINGCLALFSILLSGIYILTKRILLQFWAHFTLAGYTNYLFKKYRKTKKIRMSNEKDLYPNEDGGQDDSTE